MTATPKHEEITFPLRPDWVYWPGSLEVLRNSEQGPRIFAKQTSKFDKTLVEEIKAKVVDDELGNVLGYNFIYGNNDNKDAVSTTLSIIAEKVGYRKAFINVIAHQYVGILLTV